MFLETRVERFRLIKIERAQLNNINFNTLTFLSSYFPFPTFLWDDYGSEMVFLGSSWRNQIRISYFRKMGDHLIGLDSWAYVPDRTLANMLSWEQV